MYKNQKHNLKITNYSFGRIIGECKCKKWAKQYLLSLEEEKNIKLQIEVFKDYIKHLKKS